MVLRKNVNNNQFPKICSQILGIVLYISIAHSLYARTQTNHLPSGFQWRYTIDEINAKPRSGKFWRSGIILQDKLIALNTFHLIALDFNGNELWKYGLPASNAFSEASIYATDTNEIVVIITDSLLRINTDDGSMITHYSYDSRKRSAFQFTELLPRHSIFYQDNIYVFLGPQLLRFDRKNLQRNLAYNFNSSPKTVPILYQNKFVTSFYNGFLEAYDPVENKKSVLSYGSENPQYSVRQPVINDELLYVPSSIDIQVYSNDSLLVQSSTFKDNVLDNICNKIYLRQHQSGVISQIDETLTPIRQVRFTEERYANKINSPLAGNNQNLVQIDGVEGQLFVIDQATFSLKETIYSEDFLDSAPLQKLYQTDTLLLLGAFNGLYLINMNEL